MARPTWRFADTEEYVYGLKVLREEFERMRGPKLPLVDFAKSILTSYGETAPPPSKILNTVIEMLDYEVEHYENPAVKVYVSSLTTDANSLRMKAEYGDCVIGLSFELPWTAYHAPEPFTSTMLSRVTYDENEFRLLAPRIGLEPLPSARRDILRQREWLQGLPEEGLRVQAIASWITETLCLLAPNLKRPEFGFEKEWRLKSAVSSFASSQHFPRRALQSQASHLPREALFVDDARSRYIQSLLSLDRGEMLVSSVELPKDRLDRDLDRWLRVWRRANQSPWLRPPSLLRPGSAGLNALMQAPTPIKGIPEFDASLPIPPQFLEFRKRMRKGPSDWRPPMPLGMNFVHYLREWKDG